MTSGEGVEVNVGSNIHVYYCGVYDNYIGGIILTYKDHRKYMDSTRDSDGNLLVRKHEIESGYNGTEATVFMLNPANGKGLLDSYLGAISPTNFGRLLSKVHSQCRRQLITAKASELVSSEGITKSQARSRALNYYGGDFEYNLLATDDDLNVIDDFSAIKKVSVGFEAALIDAPTFTPVMDLASAGNISINIEESNSVQNVQAAIRTMWAAFGTSESKLSLLGVLASSGEELQLKLGKNIKHFGQCKYDDYIDYLPDTKWIDFPESQAFTRILESIKGKTATFGRPLSAASWYVEPPMAEPEVPELGTEHAS